ncbi:MAG: Na+/H+ antiporter NhaC [Bacteroidetes bacterium]|jgi:NhaC family Na+:H+ antiporter|nr:Na+/H+ antiporter NhaC [Bacteroidota bacterium]
MLTKVPKISLLEALIPIVFLIVLLWFNVQEVYGDGALDGANQFVLLLSGAVAAIVGFKNKVSFDRMMTAVAKNLKSTSTALLILLFVGALAGTWLISGIIPAMIYYGMQLLNPTIFLVASVVIACIISVATGSSWTTSATVGIALIGIGKAIGLSEGMVAGAVISGAYFGDKMSPLSDTTNLAPAMAGTDLFTHIKYMAYTTVPSITITIIIFLFLGFTQTTSGVTDTSVLLNAIDSSFNISLWLFAVPVLVILMIVKKTQPLIALLIGTLLGGVFALIFQPAIVLSVSGEESLNLVSAYKGVMNAITVDASVETGNVLLNELFTSGGMKGMLGTIWLIMCAMVFGGVMEAIGALKALSDALLKMASGIFGLFASTVGACIGFNITASDQYLAIVVPGKMFAKAYEEKGLAPENLSRTLEDSGTVTSVLIPWNTCGAYQSKVLLGEVGMTSYIPYAFFNIISPIMTLLFAAFNIKIRMLKDKAIAE